MWSSLRRGHWSVATDSLIDVRPADIGQQWSKAWQLWTQSGHCVTVNTLARGGCIGDTRRDNYTEVTPFCNIVARFTRKEIITSVIKWPAFRCVRSLTTAIAKLLVFPLGLRGSTDGNETTLETDSQVDFVAWFTWCTRKEIITSVIKWNTN